MSKQYLGNKMNQDQTSKLPRGLRAVLHIVNADTELRLKVLPAIDIERQSIDWQKVWRNDFGGGHSSAVIWAQALWCDSVVTKSDPFDRAFAMDQKLQVVRFEAIAIRWGLTK